MYDDSDDAAVMSKAWHDHRERQREGPFAVCPCCARPKIHKGEASLREHMRTVHRWSPKRWQRLRRILLSRTAPPHRGADPC